MQYLVLVLCQNSLKDKKFEQIKLELERNYGPVKLLQSLIKAGVCSYKILLKRQETDSKLPELSKQYKFDYFIFKQEYLDTVPQLVVFDMDSTLIPIEVIDELAEEAGCKAEVERVTEAAMRGEIDFKASLKERVAQLKGLSLVAFENVKEKAKFNPGVEDFCDYIRVNGGQVAIASGGFVQFAKHLQQKIPFYKVAANQLEFENSSSGDHSLSGKVLGSIVDAQTKASLLKAWSIELNINPAQAMAVGDGANDLLMLAQAGLGVAYHAKPAVNAQVSMVLRYAEMSALIAVLEIMQKNDSSSK